MKKISSYLLILVLLFVFSASVVIAKSEKANTGNSDQAQNSQKDKKDSEDSVRGNSSVENSDKGQGKAQNETKKLEKQEDKSQSKQGGLIKGSDSQKKGKFSEISGGKIATAGAKQTKLLKVSVKESTGAAQSKRRAVHGVVTSVNGSLITLAHQIQRDRAYQVLISSQTLIQSKSEKSATSSASIAPGVRIVAVGDLNGSGQIVAKRVKIIPGKATGIFSKNPLSTQSATQSASPTPVVSLAPSPTASSSATPSASPSSE